MTTVSLNTPKPAPTHTSGIQRVLPVLPIIAGLILVMIWLAGAAVQPAQGLVSAEGGEAQFAVGAEARGQTALEADVCSQIAANAPSAAEENLDHNAADWGVYCELTPTWAISNVATPSLDGKSLRLSLTGGAAYSNAHFYRTLLPEAAAEFSLSLFFWFTPTTSYNNPPGQESSMQALEFTMNQWQGGKRYEWALQWQNVGDDAPQWRYWDPHRPPAERWVTLGIADALEGERWHPLTLEGAVVNGQVYYRKFSIDGHEYPLNLMLAPADAPLEADRLAVAVQLNGTAAQHAYQVFIDRVNFTHRPTDTLLAEGFEEDVFPPAGWEQVVVDSPSLPGGWAQGMVGSNPVVYPARGESMARFSASAWPTRLSTPCAQPDQGE